VPPGALALYSPTLDQAQPISNYSK